MTEEFSRKVSRSTGASTPKVGEVSRASGIGASHSNEPDKNVGVSSDALGTEPSRISDPTAKHARSSVSVGEGAPDRTTPSDKVYEPPKQAVRDFRTPDSEQTNVTRLPLLDSDVRPPDGERNERHSTASTPRRSHPAGDLAPQSRDLSAALPAATAVVAKPKIKHRKKAKKKASLPTSEATSERPAGRRENYWRSLPPIKGPTVEGLVDGILPHDNPDQGFEVAFELLTKHASNFVTAFKAQLTAQSIADPGMMDRREAAELKATYEELVGKMKNEAEWLAREKEELTAKLADAEKSLQAIRASTIWRLTSPLRGAVMATRSIVKALTTRPKSFRNRVGSDRPLRPTPRGPLNGTTPDSSVTLPPRVRIVAVGDGPIPSIFLGLDAPLSDIAVRHGGQFSLHYESDLPVESILRSADIVFVKRACTDATVKMVRYLREIETPVVYMIDDNFSEIPPDSPLGRRYREMNGPANVRRLCELADVTVTWSKNFADKLRPYARKMMVFNGPSNIEMFDEIGRAKRADKRMRIGYAGGGTHGPDLEIIRPAVLGLLDRHQNVDFESIGLEIPWLRDHARYRHFAGAPVLKDYYRIVASRGWDIAVAPLADTRFNEAKSDNKFREYAAVGFPGVYSRVPTYEASVRQGETGILVDNTTEAWSSALEKMLLNRTLRQKVAAGAEFDARGKYSRNEVNRQYEDLIAETTRPHRVLAVGPTGIATFAIDIDGPFKILRRKHVAHLRTREVRHVTPEDLRWATTLVVVRAFEPETRSLVRMAKRAGCTVVYSWDDNWVAFPNEDTALARHVHHPANRESLFEILREVDLIKATTPEIYEESCRHNRRVVLHPYGFDFDLTQHRPPTFRRDGRIRLGYFGTPGRDAQFDFVIEAIKSVQQKHSNLDLEFFGFNPRRGSELSRVTNLPYAEGYEASIRGLMARHWDIALAPLADTTFNRSKLPTKYRDYAAVGAAGVYTWMPPYETVVTNFRTGILAKNTVDAWTEAITRLVEDSDLRETIAQEAFEHVRRSYSAEIAAQHWRDILDNVSGRKKQ